MIPIKKFLIIQIILSVIVAPLGKYSVYAVDTCSRIAYINFQEVLVDTSSTNRGEGLRYYLEKDEISKELLNEYQEKNRPSFGSAAFSTTGSFLLMMGMLGVNSGKDEAVFNRTNFIFGGVIMIALSYLSTFTIRYRNEVYLERAIEQYNKRNLPKIFFSPYNDDGVINAGVGIGYQKEF